MIGEFTLENLSLGINKKFGQELDCDYLYQDDGIDWGSVPADHNTYNYPNQIGDTFSSSKIKNRDISIVAYAYYVLSEEERTRVSRDKQEKYAYEKIKQKKDELNSLVNPNDLLRVTIGNYYIEGKPSATVKYGVGYKENNTYFCKFLISLFCADPMFKKITKTESALSGNIPAFSFPLYFDNGKIMGTRVEYQVIILNNEGNTSIGGKIYIQAKGTVINPIIENISTGEHIKINKTLTLGEVITIDTSDGPTKGIWGTKNNVTRDYLQYWDFTNTWLKFLPGTTILGYDADSDTKEYMQVDVDINPEKFGLEEM